MNIQTFLNGELVDEREDEIILPPNIAGFTTGMLFSPNYMKLIANAQDTDAKARIELLSVRLELKSQITIDDLQIFKLVWDALAGSVPLGILDPEDKAEYNRIAEANYMPFRFGENFKLEILLNE